jgi:hypothetical protein
MLETEVEKYSMPGRDDTQNDNVILGYTLIG